MTAHLPDLAATLRAWGLTVVEVPGWQTRGRPGAFAPIGVLEHHTAAPDRTKDAPSLGVCTDGRADLPGPLCQILVARSGICHLIAAGRCNHAGAGGPLGPIAAGDGNTSMVGIEAENDGLGEPWPDVQVDAIARASAAVLDLLDRPRWNCWGHKEWAPGRKPDPKFDMAQFRAKVAAAQITPPPEIDMPYSRLHLAAALGSVAEIYHNHRPMTPMIPSERDAWAKDIEARLSRGEDPAATLNYIAYALDKAL